MWLFLTAVDFTLILIVILLDSDIAEVDGMLHAGGISLSPLGQMDRDIREGRLSSALTASTNTVGLPLQPTTSHRYKKRHERIVL